MARWDIDVAGVVGVLQRAGNEAESYESDLTQVETAATNAEVGLVNSPLVLMRLGEFAQEVATPHLEKVVGHTASALQGTGAAVQAYVDGDLEMAAEAQRNATAAVYPTDVPGAGGGSGGQGGSGEGQGGG